MAKKRTSVLLAGLAAGAYAYLKKPENREKALEALNSTKAKMNDFMDAQKKKVTLDSQTENQETASQTEILRGSTFDDSITGDENKDYLIEDKEMVSEGSLTKVQYENAEQQERLEKKFSDLDASEQLGTNENDFNSTLFQEDTVNTSTTFGQDNNGFNQDSRF